MSNDHLLRPTLSQYAKVPALYHSTGFFLSAFFGGPVGAAVYSLANCERLSRLRQDGTLIVVVVVLALLVPVALGRFGGWQPVADFLGTEPRRAGELLLRALGLACFGVIYLLQRRFFRAASVAGVKPLPGWVPGITAILLGWVANGALLGWVLKHH